MKKIVKKLMASMLSVATLATSVVGISANAANTTDNPFSSFHIYPNVHWTRLNQTDSKEDYSYVYLYISSASRGVRVHALGIDSNGYAHNCTCDGNVYCVAGNEYLICNSIKESGYNYADLEFYSASTYYEDYISGVWSPDSVIEYGHTYYYV